VRILVTGANGYVGGHLIEHLAREGAEVIAAVRPGSDPGTLAKFLSASQIIQVDLRDPALGGRLPRLEGGTCIHAAWFVRHGRFLTAEENLECVSMSVNLLRAVASVGCARIVGLGTCFEYDTSVGYLREDSPERPMTLYAASKLALRTVLEAFARQRGIDWSWVRLFYLFGGREQPARLVPYLIRVVQHNGVVPLRSPESIRDYLHVEDVVAGISTVALNRLTGVINLGSGQPISVRDIAVQIGDLLGKDVTIEAGAGEEASTDPPFVCANTERLKRLTSWRPALTLQEGLRRTIAERSRF
jgi:nucleoside-diphosphate-sugar epimerase